jgi:hypothetical protein
MTSKKTAQNYPFDLAKAREVFEDTYQEIGADLQQCRIFAEGEDNGISRKDLFEVCLDHYRDHNPEPALVEWINKTKWSKLMALAPHVLPYETYM